ncbi:MAG: hypothetical protein NVSMB66_5020 [Candidatus Doudnabacteria bacterium]
MKSKIILAAAMVALLAAGCNRSPKSDADNSQNTPSNYAIGLQQNSQAQSSAPAASAPPAQVSPSPSPTTGAHYSDGSEADIPPTGAVKIITITSSGFSPSSVNIKKGDYVKFINQDSSAHWPASDPHPSHTGYPGFDALRGLAQGESYTFQFQKSGTWGFHDHLNASWRGKVVVQ